MKIKTRLMLFTAAAAFSASMAYAAIDPQALADSYTADGYTYVEIKQGPTQTKLEAIKGDVHVEVVYANDTGAILSQESQPVDPEDAAKTGIEIKLVGAESEDTPDANDDGDNHDDGASDDQGEDDHSGGDDSNDDSNDDHGGNSGSGGDGGSSGSDDDSDGD